jgi:hypothetical protein
VSSPPATAAISSSSSIASLLRSDGNRFTHAGNYGNTVRVLRFPGLESAHPGSRAARLGDLGEWSRGPCRARMTPRGERDGRPVLLRVRARLGVVSLSRTSGRQARRQWGGMAPAVAAATTRGGYTGARCLRPAGVGGGVQQHRRAARQRDRGEELRDLVGPHHGKAEFTLLAEAPGLLLGDEGRPVGGPPVHLR